MSSIKSKNTGPERALGKALWATGLRYRKHRRDIPGSPDFVLISTKIAIFCDGDFWHGNNWRLRGLPSLKHELRTYSEFWREKIRANIARDRKNEDQLRSRGWLVMRFWGSQIQLDAQVCARAVAREHNRRQRRA